MADLLKNAYASEPFRRHGHALIERLANYLDSCLGRSEMTVLPWAEPGQLADKWRSILDVKGGGELAPLVEQFISDSIHLHHPRYMGHQVVPPAPLAALVELVSDLLNNSMAVFEVGPAGTAVEQAVISWLGRRLGFAADCGGLLTSGGSIGNLTALLAARQNLSGRDVWRQGLFSGKPLALMVSAEAHYSIDRAARIMGLGEQGVIRLPVRENLQVDVSALEPTLAAAEAAGREIMALAASACTTAAGVYDPLAEMAAFCRRHGIWFHVDGAHGAGAILTAKYCDRVHGIEQADSVVVDFHKMLLCPALTTAVVYRDGRHAQAAFSQQAAYLLENESDQDSPDLAGRTLECTKKMMGLKIFALLNVFGEELFAQYISRTYGLAEEFADLVRATADFELALAPQANIVCFRHRPEGIPEPRLDEHNARIRRDIVRSGRFYIVQAKIRDQLFLRLTLMNPFTTGADFQDLLGAIRASH